MINAAVGFDEQTLAPTYELRLGVPGPSAGINIAQRLGLEASIVEEARSRLNTQSRNIAGFLDQLHAQLDLPSPRSASSCGCGSGRWRSSGAASTARA